MLKLRNLIIGGIYILCILVLFPKDILLLLILVPVLLIIFERLKYSKNNKYRSFFSFLSIIAVLGFIGNCIVYWSTLSNETPYLVSLINLLSIIPGLNGEYISKYNMYVLALAMLYFIGVLVSSVKSKHEEDEDLVYAALGKDNALTALFVIMLISTGFFVTDSYAIFKDFLEANYFIGSLITTIAALMVIYEMRDQKNIMSQTLTKMDSQDTKMQGTLDAMENQTKIMTKTLDEMTEQRKEMEKQRLSSYRPKLTPLNTQYWFKFLNSLHHRTYFVSKSKTGLEEMLSEFPLEVSADFKDNYYENFQKMYVEISNIGLGSAKNIEFTFEFNYPKFIDSINDKLTESKRMEYSKEKLEYSDGTGSESYWKINFPISGIEELKIYPEKEPHKAYYNVLTPLNLKNDSILLKLPAEFMELISYWVRYAGEVDPPNIPEFKLKISYEDFEGNSFPDDEYVIDMNISDIYDVGENFEGCLLDFKVRNDPKKPNIRPTTTIVIDL